MSRARPGSATVGQTAPIDCEEIVRARFVTPVRNAVVLLASFFLLAVG